MDMKKNCGLIKILAMILTITNLLAIRTFATTGSSEIVLTWSGDPKTTQTVSWKSNTTTATSTLHYKIADTADKAEQRMVAFEKLPQAPGDDPVDQNLFTIKLTGLKPGTKYAYTITSGSTTSETHTFSTEAAVSADFKFLVFGDSQSESFGNPDYQPWHETVQQAYRKNPDAKFFVNVGDLVDNGQSYAHWKNWFAAGRGVIDTIPAMPVQGNHENYYPSRLQRDSKPIYFLNQFKLPANGPNKLRGQVYSYDYGSVHFVVLDSQEDEEAAKAGDILTPQSKWLEHDLGGTSKPWKIVFFHKPPYNNKLGRPHAAVKQAFCPVFDKYHVDLVFNGHEHGLYRTYPIKADKIQKKPKDGTVYYTTGRSGGKYYYDMGPTEWDAFAFNPQDQPCYETVQVNDLQLVITAYKQDGTLIDRYALNK